ncbi:MAG: NAD(P)H-hydrate epimerase, partial [Myxococcales bacterium]|nr:NAD(P)H-hydrate epimerase [Myxococcales bacterium]
MGFLQSLAAARDAGYVLTPAEMRAVDRHAIESLGIPGVALMENAARHVAAFAARCTRRGGRIGVVCGGGNNGGDGLAAARHLAAWGFDVEVVRLETGRLSGDAETHLRVVDALGLAVRTVDDMASVATLPAPGHYQTLVDAVLGTGLRGPVTGGARELLSWINGHGATVVAVDVPSGLCGRTGRPLGTAVRAQQTVTFGASKTGHWLHPGPEYVGALHVVDIGLPPGLVAAHAGGRVVLGDAALARASAPRRLDDHKGRLGHLWVLAGSPGRSGAAR